MDFVLHSIGISPNVRKGNSYDDLNYEWYKQTVDINAMSFHRQRCRSSTSGWHSIPSATR